MVEMNWLKSLLVAVTVVAGACSVPGCASEPPPSRSNQEIKTDSDRMFEKMKQDERERNKEPGPTTR
jgi:hypothetical protein